MKQLTRQEVEGLIKRLADKTLNFGCMLDDQNHSPSQIMFVGHGIGQTYSIILVDVYYILINNNYGNEQNVFRM